MTREEPDDRELPWSELNTSVPRTRDRMESAAAAKPRIRVILDGVDTRADMGSILSKTPVTLLLALSIPVVLADSAPITIDEAASCLGLSAQQMEDVRAGKIVSTDFRELSDKELAITVTMLVDRPIDDIADAVRNTGLLESDPHVVRFKALGDKDPTEADLADLTLSKDDGAEVRRLLNVKPGSEFNLSETEVSGFNRLKERFSGACDKAPACTAAVIDEYRRVLLVRLRDYRRGGTEAIAPYAREGGKVAKPGEEIRTAEQGCELVRQRLPDVIRAF